MPFNPSLEINWPDVAQLMPLARQRTLVHCGLLLRSRIGEHETRVFWSHGLPREDCICQSLPLYAFKSSEAFSSNGRMRQCLVKQTGGVQGFSTYNLLRISSEKEIRRAVPVGKCSLMGQLSTCNVALPPFLVNRTKWYFPSFTAVLVSFTLMSTVPMLNVTPTLPCSWKKK